MNNNTNNEHIEIKVKKIEDRLTKLENKFEKLQDQLEEDFKSIEEQIRTLGIFMKPTYQFLTKKFGKSYDNFLNTDSEVTQYVPLSGGKKTRIVKKKSNTKKISKS